MISMTKELSNKFANMALLCAALVVSIHIGRNDVIGSPAWFFSEIVSSGIAGIAIPFFFFASGFFLSAHVNESGWWSHEMKKRCKTLLLPFFIWNILFLLYANGIQLLSNVVAHAPLSRDIVIPGVLSIFGLNVFDQPALFVLWYVRALFLLVLVSPCIFALLRRFGWWMLLAFFLLYALVVPGDDDGSVRWMQPLKWTFSLLGLFYFSLGAWARQKVVDAAACRVCNGGDSAFFKRDRLSRLQGLALILGFGLLGVQVAARYYGWSLPFSLRPMMVFTLMFGIFGLMPAAKLPSWLSGCAFAIFILHCFCRFVPMTALKHSSDSLCGLLTVWGVTVALCVIVTVLMRRFLPRVTAFLFGGR